MSCDMYETKTVTTRKPHTCEYCGKPISPRTPGVLAEFGLFEGGFFRRYACPECAPMVNEFWRYMDYECFDFQVDWREFMRECHPELVGEDSDD